MELLVGGVGWMKDRSGMEFGSGGFRRWSGEDRTDSDGDGHWATHHWIRSRLRNYSDQSTIQ